MLFNLSYNRRQHYEMSAKSINESQNVCQDIHVFVISVEIKK